VLKRQFSTFQKLAERGIMAKRKILVVDDEEDITNTVALMLRSRGFDVVTAYEVMGLQRQKSNTRI
jgi:DNA-binding NtrC family response regulator